MAASSFGLGTLIAGYADQVGNITLLYIGFGVIAALGNGFGYVTPIATLIRWFPDKRGLVTGLAVMGFGAGAFFMGKIAPAMIASFKQVDASGNVLASGVAMTWYIWGVIFLILVAGAAQFFKNPPAGWVPAGFKPAGTTVSAADSFNLRRSRQTSPVVDALVHVVPQRLRRSGSYFPALSAGSGYLQKNHGAFG